MTSLLPPAPSNDSFERLHGQIRELLSTARARIRRAVNSTMVQTYWTIGRLIVEEEQGGSARAAYGQAVLAALSERLTAEFGKGFSVANLR